MDDPWRWIVIGLTAFVTLLVVFSSAGRSDYQEYVRRRKALAAQARAYEQDHPLSN